MGYKIGLRIILRRILLFTGLCLYSISVIKGAGYIKKDKRWIILSNEYCTYIIHNPIVEI